MPAAAARRLAGRRAHDIFPFANTATVSGVTWPRPKGVQAVDTIVNLQGASGALLFASTGFISGKLGLTIGTAA